MYTDTQQADLSTECFIDDMLKLLANKTLGQYGTFELRIRSEFYCSNDVIVGQISLNE